MTGIFASLATVDADGLKTLKRMLKQYESILELVMLKVFNDFQKRAGKIRNGFQTNCHHCSCVTTFDLGAEDPNIRRALAAAREMRVLLEKMPAPAAD